MAKIDYLAMSGNDASKISSDLKSIHNIDFDVEGALKDGYTHEDINSYLQGLGGEDPTQPKKKAVFTSQEQINKANEFVRDLLRRQNVDTFNVENTYVAKKVGDPMPEWVFNGVPYNTNRATDLPYGVKISDVVDTQEGYGYFHPQNGNWVPVDINAITAKYGKKK